MILSLVQTCRNRYKELQRFIVSLNNQTNINFTDIEYIFIDQGNNEAILTYINSSIKVKYIKTSPCSLSQARNIGLKYVSGEYVGFPDDDCWYTKDTLSKVLDYLNTGVDGVVAKGTDEYGRLTNVFPEGKKVLNKFERCGAISYTIFVRFHNYILFDENLGVGSPYGLNAGEETDYILRLLEKNGSKIIYDSSIIVHHPVFAEKINRYTLAKIRSYSRGNGYLLHKHNFPIGYVLMQLVRPLCGCLVYFFQGKIKRSRHSFNVFAGRLQGYFFRIHN